MKNLFAFLFGFLMSCTAFAQERILEVEPNHSTVGFRISISGFTEVTGKFTDYTIDAIVDDTDFSRSIFEASIKAASINTGIKARDEHLRSADFFDVEQFPEITFKTDSIRQVNFANFIAHGQFTMHGVTKVLELPFTIIKKDGNTIGFKCRTTINRLDYGVGAGFAHTSMDDFLAAIIQVEIDFWTRKKKIKKPEQYD